MIASLNGKILSKKPEGIIIDVGGVGYRINIPLSNLGDVPEAGEQAFFHIHTHVKEDAFQLFGFVSDDDRRLFTTLIGISGIGPKMGLAILSGMPGRRFIETVNNEDISLLTTIPGLGNKKAARLVLELKGKLPSMTTEEAGETTKISVSDDAISALVNLGYKRASAEKAVKKAEAGGADIIEVIIKEALKYLTDNK